MTIDGGGWTLALKADGSNMASCSPDNGDKSLQAFGVVFVR